MLYDHKKVVKTISWYFEKKIIICMYSFLILKETLSVSMKNNIYNFDDNFIEMIILLFQMAIYFYEFENIFCFICRLARLVRKYISSVQNIKLSKTSFFSRQKEIFTQSLEHTTIILITMVQ